MSGAAGYKVFVRQSGQSFGAGTNVGNPAMGGDGALHYVVTGLPTDVANLFAVSAYNGTGAESVLSNELSLMVTATPTPTVGAGTVLPTATNTATRTPTNTAPSPTSPSTATPTRSVTRTPTGSPVATVAGNGPVAAYAFSEGSGTTTADVSGYGRNGTLFGAPVWTAGRSGMALQFSGGTTWDGVNLAPDNTFDGLSEGTLEAWVKFDTSAPAGVYNWFNGRDAAECSYPFEVDLNTRSGTVYWEIWAGDTAQCSATFWARVALANPSQWHHLAYVVSNSGNTWYVDGVPQTPTYFAGSAATKFFLASIADSPNTRYDVGTTDIPSGTFKGIIDELRIYARPLTQGEIQADMNAPVGAAVPTSTATRTASSTATATNTAVPPATATRTATSTATPPPTSTPTASVTRTATRTASATATNTSPPTSTATATRSSTATATSTRTPPSTPTRTPPSTATSSATATRTATATNTAPPTSTTTATRSSTATATYTATPLPTNTITATATRTPPSTATRSASASATATATRTAAATTTATNTALPASTATATRTNVPSTPTATRTTVPSTSTATATATSPPINTITATATRTQPSTATSSASPSATATTTRTATATNTSPPTSTASATDTAVPSSTPTATYTATSPPTRTATATHTPPATATATAAPSETAMSTRTATATQPPTSTASATETAAPDSTETATYTAEPAPTKTPTATSPPDPTAVETETAVATATDTPAPTSSETATDAVTPTATDAPPPTSTATGTATTTPTDTLPPPATPSFTPAPTATPVPAWSVSIPTDVLAMPGTTVGVPVTIAPGSGVRQFALHITFDPDVVAVQGVELSADAGTGTLDADFSSPGYLTISAALLQPMTGGGALVDVSFTAVGACPASTRLALASCVLDGGAIGCEPNEGSLLVGCGVAGSIRHWFSTAPVGGAVVAMRGRQGSVTATTNELGQFGFGETTTGTWQLEPQKSGDMQGAVSALDASIVLQAAAGQEQLDAVQELACDVTGNGHVTALDAARILQLVVGRVSQLPVAQTCGSDWAFVPAPADVPNQTLIEPELTIRTCQPGGIVLDPLLGDAPEQNFTAVLFGDCSGNWTSGAQGTARLRLAHDVRVRLGAARPRRGGEWVVPLYVASAAPFRALDARIAYDPAARPASLRAVGAAHDGIARYGTDGRGTLTLAVASAAPLTADGGPVAVLVFDGPSRRAAGPLPRLLHAAIDEVPVDIGN